MTSTAINRHRERAKTRRAELDAILDAIPFGTLCTAVDGRPWVVPMLFARLDDRIILHGSTGAGALRHVAAGAPAALCVTAIDAVVVASSTFESSANYRSAVVNGVLTPLTDDDKSDALQALSERLIPGRTTEVRPMLPKELAATLAVALPIDDGSWTVKVRTGGPGEPTESSDAWEGIVPVTTVFGEPEPAAWIPQGRAVPESVHRLIAEGWR